ncbi:sugar phosphate isomerase/epimerase family protein [Methanospirillum stamsii]|uniref:Sugar phosphate isomerase/epimerase n=1 Tax=Methanospirillum stamsii TaxID=1277351 RepID=A0A2V2NEV7_9EURY|nr:sugar phosphate isomerase/epimerase family protein [Methanospirillum stamsii]PWR76106.1 sugar phosphate isomerase/epimerase [Methanospirillum stamsii]
MVISFSSMFFHDFVLDDIFQACNESGADTLEFWLETPYFWLNGLNEDYLMEVINTHNISCPLSVHAPVLDLNPCSINPDVREVSILWIERSIKLAEKIGASVCTIHPGRRTAKRPPTITDYQRLGHMLDTIEPLAESVQVKVAIENMEPAVNALLTSPEEIQKILDGRPWLWFTFDVAHALRRGLTVTGDFLKIKKIANIHISGSNEQKMHGLVSQDPLALEFLPRIKESGFSGPLTLELNDLTLSKQHNYQEKIQVLKNEISGIRTYLQ